MTHTLWLAGGFVLLVMGAEWLVLGASRLACSVGVPALVVGLTVVALGTSAPELAVSIGSALAGSPDIAVGNVVGSNIINVLLILGASALAAPLTVTSRVVRLDVPIMIFVSLLAWMFAADGRFGRLECALLGFGALAYTGLQLVLGRRSAQAASAATPEPARGGIAADLALIVLGLVLLSLGSRWLLQGATDLARDLGVPELLIGLTIVAVGTSLPELTTSVLAAIRGAREIAVGNIVGSNIYNILLVLGTAGSIAPAGIAVAPSALAFDLPVMVAVAVACLPIFFRRHRIARWEGAVFLGYYLAYTGFLVLMATGHDAARGFGQAMLIFVLPITVLTFAVLMYRGRGPAPLDG